MSNRTEQLTVNGQLIRIEQNGREIALHASGLDSNVRVLDTVAEATAAYDNYVTAAKATR